MKKIGIIITTFMRDKLFFKSVQSILDNLQDNFQIIIVDQGNSSQQKFDFITTLHSPTNVNYFRVPFDCGLSYARNYGVERAKDKKCYFCLISADSIIFNNSIKNINKLFYLFEDNIKLGKIGFKLLNRIGWEGWLSIIPNKSFKIKFINKNKFSINNKLQAKVIPCNICKNFYLATVDSLLNIPYDNKLKLMEHEDHSIRYAKQYETLWTDLISATYIDFKPTKYKQYRQRMYREFMKILLSKYNLKQWIAYEDLQYSKT